MGRVEPLAAIAAASEAQRRPLRRHILETKVQAVAASLPRLTAIHVV